MWFPLLLLMGLLVAATIIVNELRKMFGLAVSAKRVPSGESRAQHCTRDGYAVASCWDGAFSERELRGGQGRATDDEGEPSRSGPPEVSVVVVAVEAKPPSERRVTQGPACGTDPEVSMTQSQVRPVERVPAPAEAVKAQSQAAVPGRVLTPEQVAEAPPVFMLTAVGAPLPRHRFVPSRLQRRAS